MPPDDRDSTRRTPRILLALAAVLLVARVVTGVIEARRPVRVPSLAPTIQMRSSGPMPWPAGPPAPGPPRAPGAPAPADSTLPR